MTIKELTEMPDESFTGTKYVILSACNTGVSFSPSAIGEKMENMYSEKDTERKLRYAGWVPGIDQVSFVDIFMRRGVPNVYGTLWFAEDGYSNILMSEFIKNLQSDNADPVAAFSKAQRELVKKGKDDKAVGKENEYKVPQHPFFWAVGAIFGK